MEKHYSTDGKFYVVFAKTKIHLLKWIYSPIIYSSDGTPVFDLSQSVWHTKKITWQEDRSQLQFTLHTPGSKKEITIYLDPETKNCILMENKLIRNMSIEKAVSYLKTYESAI
jgi:hypothetical protein